MQFKDQLEFVSQHVKKNKMRIFTTILATTMGCAFLIVLASIAFGLEGSIKDEILSDDSLTKIEVYENEENKIDVGKIKSFDDVSAVVNLINIQADVLNTAKFENRTADSVSMQLTNFAENKKAKIPLSSGSYPTKENGIVVGYNFAETLVSEAEMKNMKVSTASEEKEKDTVGYKGNLLGKKIKLSWVLPSDEKKIVSKEFIITGISEKPVKEWDFNSRILLSDTLEKTLTADFVQKFGDKINKEELFDTSYLVFAKDLEAVKAVNKQLKDMNYSTYTVSQQLEEISLIFGVLKAGLLFIGTIAILIASIGIFNTMTMAVTERTREIGVMKAIGASPKLIQRLFVMESAYIGIIGTVIAIIISYAISIISNFAIPKILFAVTNEEAYKTTAITFSSIPWELVLTASVISIGVAVLSGWRPARKATKIDVIQALKQD
ncbi:MAG: ABC transporter permease [Kurthia sp.]|nr:ABC transporter permease [Candidatus Kurthia equi]